MDHYALPVSVLQDLEATAIYTVQVVSHATLCRIGPDKVPDRTITRLNAKQPDWNSELTTAMGRLLRDYANKNSLLSVLNIV
jgi:hypothetical protein